MIRPAAAAVRAALVLAALVTLVTRGPAARQAAPVQVGTPAAAGPVVRLAYRSLQPGSRSWSSSITTGRSGRPRPRSWARPRK
ncbi:MAG: hypothetical protein M0C28_32935 [Candidatus Moduliflexus flocculans]|nr:hypothetical protein [Candidatus Moduliflexus flocculans]